MNERIKALLLNARNMFVNGVTESDNKIYIHGSEENLEKFALLIVQECIEQLRYTVLNTQELRRDKSTDYQVGWEDGMFDAGEMIKEHFRS